jgi:hypothetical protein
MLTRAQIQRLAQRNRVGMQVQERDYVQHLLLALLFARAETLIFKGGTALRLVYGGSRYSEDLELIESKLELYQLSWQPAHMNRRSDPVDVRRELVTTLCLYGASRVTLRARVSTPIGHSSKATVSTIVAANFRLRLRVRGDWDAICAPC